MNLKDIKDELSAIAREGMDRAKEDFADSQYEEGKQAQKRSDMISVVEMLLNLNVEEDKVFNLLHDFFQVDSIDELREYLNEAKVRRQKKALEGCFETKEDYLAFARKHFVFKKLRTEPGLLDLPPQKLKKALEK